MIDFFKLYPYKQNQYKLIIIIFLLFLKISQKGNYYINKNRNNILFYLIH